MMRISARKGVLIRLPPFCSLSKQRSVRVPTTGTRTSLAWNYLLLRLRADGTSSELVRPKGEGVRASVDIARARPCGCPCVGKRRQALQPHRGALEADQTDRIAADAVDPVAAADRVPVCWNVVRGAHVAKVNVESVLIAADVS